MDRVPLLTVVLSCIVSISMAVAFISGSLATHFIGSPAALTASKLQLVSGVIAAVSFLVFSLNVATILGKTDR